jgi:hypothetical protein
MALHRSLLTMAVVCLALGGVLALRLPDQAGAVTTVQTPPAPTTSRTTTPADSATSGTGETSVKTAASCPALATNGSAEPQSKQAPLLGDPAAQPKVNTPSPKDDCTSTPINQTTAPVNRTVEPR